VKNRACGTAFDYFGLKVYALSDFQDGIIPCGTRRIDESTLKR